MRAYVFTDKALRRYAGQFVWLSLDVEKAENAQYRKKYATDALPMFFVLDPKTEKAALRWVGGATVPQLQKILADGLTAVKGSSGGRGLDEVLARATARQRRITRRRFGSRRAIGVAPRERPNRSSTLC